MVQDVSLALWCGSKYKSSRVEHLPDISFLRPTISISQRWIFKEPATTNFEIVTLTFQMWVNLPWIGTSNHQIPKPEGNAEII